MFGMIARLCYQPFKNAILSAWNAAKADAISEIRAEIQVETEADDALADLRPAIEDKKKKK